MTEEPTNRLFELLPRVVRADDGLHGPLFALLQLIDDQRRLIETDVAALYDDLFIETCADWVVPHLGALIGAAEGATRAEVANTIARRTHPGLLATLKGLARDITGRPVTGAEIATGADGADHPRVDLVVHLLDAMPMEQADARPVQPGCFTVHPMGVDAPLFHDPTGQPDLAEHVPFPLRRSDTAAHLATHLTVLVDGVPVPAGDLEPTSLALWRRPLDARTVYIDPERGRLSVGDQRMAARVRVSHAYGSFADIGGGPYPRQAAFDRAALARQGGAVLAVRSEDRGCGPEHLTLPAALARLADHPHAHAVIEVGDNGIHHLHSEPGEQRAVAVQMTAGGTLTIAGGEGARPCLVGDLVVHGPATGTATLVIDGCWLEGTLDIRGSVETTVRHSTLRAPDVVARVGRPAVSVVTDREASLAVVSSIVGPIRLAGAVSLRADDSVVDAPASPALCGPTNGELPADCSVVMRRCRIGGEVRARHALLVECGPAQGSFGEPSFGTVDRPLGAAMDRLTNQLQLHMPLDVDLQVFLA